jgi:hypothetical protein
VGFGWLDGWVFNGQGKNRRGVEEYGRFGFGEGCLSVMWSLDGVHCTFFVSPFVVSNHLGMVVWIIFGRLGFFFGLISGFTCLG